MTNITISDVARLFVGKDVDKKKCNEDGKGLPVILGASSMQADGIKTIRYSEPTERSVISKFGDVLVSRVGTCGKVMVNNIGDAIITNSVIAVRFFPWLLPAEIGILIILNEINKGLVPEFDEGTIGFSRTIEADLIGNIEIFPLDTAENIESVGKMKKIAASIQGLKQKKEDYTDWDSMTLNQIMSRITKDVNEIKKSEKKLRELLQDIPACNNIEKLFEGDLFQ